MDIFDRKTGKRYIVFTEPTVGTNKVTPFENGFKIDCGDILYCFIDDSDEVKTVKFDFTDNSDFQYADLADMEFWFGSGVGAWSTVVHIQPDGSFVGYYHDSNMGETGDGFHNGTRYECYFSGKFSPLVKTGEFEYSMRIEELYTEGVLGEEKIISGVKLVTSEPHGFIDADVFYLYLPGKKTDGLSEEFLWWVHWIVNDGLLTSYCIYNVGGGFGFFVE